MGIKYECVVVERRQRSRDISVALVSLVGTRAQTCARAYSCFNKEKVTKARKFASSGGTIHMKMAFFNAVGKLMLCMVIS